MKRAPRGADHSMKLPGKSKLAQSSKLRKMGAYGSLKMGKSGENAPRKYAKGGAVMDASTAVEGDMPKQRLDKPVRKGKKDGDKKAPSVNIMIVSGAGKGAPSEGGMPMPPPGAMPPPAPPMGGPPMRASGGRVTKDEDERAEKRMAHSAMRNRGGKC